MKIREVINPFQGQSHAERYHKYRPQYHDLPFNLLKNHFADAPKTVLDVACGTGHSTSALAKIFPSVTGCDASEDMLFEARKSYQLPFVQCMAEDLPFDSASIDLVNVSMGFHWFGQKKFLARVARILKPGGHLSVEQYGFLGKMKGNDSFEEFNRTFYRSNFPRPTRNQDQLSDEEMAESGFPFEREFRYDHWLKMNLKQFIEFNMTQSNLILSAKAEDPGMADWLMDSYRPYFDKDVRELYFGGVLKLYNERSS